MGLKFQPKTKEIENIFDRLMKYPVVQCNPKLGESLSKNKYIRFLRKQNTLIISHDRSKNKSIIACPSQVRIKKIDKLFKFEFFCVFS